MLRVEERAKALTKEADGYRLEARGCTTRAERLAGNVRLASFLHDDALMFITAAQDLERERSAILEGLPKTAGCFMCGDTGIVSGNGSARGAGTSKGMSPTTYIRDGSETHRVA